MDVLEDHIKHAHDTLEAARTALNAAQKRFDTMGDADSAEFLREAQAGYDEAQSAYQNAMDAKANNAAGPASNH